MYTGVLLYRSINHWCVCYNSMCVYLFVCLFGVNVYACVCVMCVMCVSVCI